MFGGERVAFCLKALAVFARPVGLIAGTKGCAEPKPTGLSVSEIGQRS